jgi:hypothetical protein
MMVVEYDGVILGEEGEASCSEGMMLVTQKCEGGGWGMVEGQISLEVVVWVVWNVL